jgi:hypothetical protein
MTIPQLFIAILDFLLFIVLGIIFIRQWALFRMLRDIKKRQIETDRMLHGFAVFDEADRMRSKHG